jgi:hypothetical protein
VLHQRAGFRTRQMYRLLDQRYVARSGPCVGVPTFGVVVGVFGRRG